jgi:hypothetical protein
VTGRPTLVGRYYDRHALGLFARFARVLDATARAHCSGWDIDIRPMRAAPIAGGTGVSGHLANTAKLDLWADLVTAAPDGAALLLIDVDTWIVRPIDELWEERFDLAYTVREGWPIPFNLGVLGVRVSSKTRAMFAAWAAENRRMFTGGDATRDWRQRFGGVNQAAFGSLLARGTLDTVAVKTLPCREWNCEDSAWRTFDAASTRIVHLKGALRAMALGEVRIDPRLRPLAMAWREIDRVANGTERRDA